MPRNEDTYKKTEKNIIIHHYVNALLDSKLTKEIEECENRLLELRRKQNAKITIAIPTNHPVLSLSSKTNNPLVKEGQLVEWSSNRVFPDGHIGQKRELVYIEKISVNSDITHLPEDCIKYMTDISYDEYTLIEGTHYANKYIIRLIGRDYNDIKDQAARKKK